MGLESGTSRYKETESVEEPLLDKSELIGRSYQTQPDALLSSSHHDDSPTVVVFGYNVGNRPVQDLIFTIIFLLLMLVVTSFGIYGVLNASPSYQNVKATFTAQIVKRVMNTRTATFGLSLALSGPLAYGFLYLLRVYTSSLISITLPFIVLLPIAVNFTWFIDCYRHIECRTEFDARGLYLAFGSIFLFIFLTGYILYAHRTRIELTTKVVKAAAEALQQNLVLLLVLPGLSLALVALCWLPVGAFMWYAYANGQEVDCAWQVAPWVPYYLYLSGFAAVWASMIVGQLQILTISATISQWYFAQAGSHSSLHATKRALRVAIGPSFGTACLAGLVVAILRVVRAAVNEGDDDRGGAHRRSAVTIFLRACLHWVFEAVEFFTRFTSNFAAITGESFYTSAVMTYNLLKRNVMSTVLVEIISDRLLISVAFVLSVAYAVLVYMMLSLFTDAARDEKLVEMVVGWAVVFSVLVLLVRVVSNVVDTVYICYAMDREQGVASKPEVHDVLVLLPASRDDNPSLAVRRDNPQ